MATSAKTVTSSMNPTGRGISGSALDSPLAKSDRTILHSALYVTTLFCCVS